MTTQRALDGTVAVLSTTIGHRRPEPLEVQGAVDDGGAMGLLSESDVSSTVIEMVVGELEKERWLRAQRERESHCY